MLEQSETYRPEALIEQYGEKISWPSMSKVCAQTGFDAHELQRMSFPPIRYVVPNYLPEGVTIKAGKPKIGKSWLALQMAIAVASGGKAFGSIPCEPGSVLFLALEDNPRRLQSRMKKLLEGNPWPKDLRLETQWPRLDQGGAEKIAQWIESNPNCRLVVIDTLARIRGSQNDKESAYSNDYKAITDLHALANEKGLAVLLLHHVRKTGADDPLDTVSGTLGLTGAADTILVLSREAVGTVLYGRGRDIAEIETAVEFNRETCQWSILGDAAEVRRSDERQAIIQAIKEAGGSLSPREISDATGQDYNNVRQLTFKMVKAGELVKAARGRYAVPTDNDDTPHNNDNTITSEDGMDYV